MHASKASQLCKAMTFLLAFIACTGSALPYQTDETTTRLIGTVLCDHPISFEDTILTANYVRFRKEYPANLTLPSKVGELPPTIPVDSSGRFSLSRVAAPMMFHCTIGDKQFAGSTQIDEQSTIMKIKLEPTVTVSGRLIDHETDAPLGNKRLIAELRYVDAVRASNSNTLGTIATYTDDNGSFKFSGLVAERKYNLSWIQISPEKHATLYSAGSFRTNRSSLNLENVDRSRDWFNSDATPIDRLNKAMEEATLSSENILVAFSYPCDAVFRKFARFPNNKDLLNAMQEYQIIAIDHSGSNANPAKELAGQLGIHLSNNLADTHFCFADAQGNLLQELTVSSHEADEFPSKQFLDAVKKNAPAAPNAQALIDAALKKAGREGKLVLLQETGPHCGPCVLLSKFLHSTRDRWSKDLIWLKLDQRWPGTLAITNRLRNKVDSTIPWYAVLDTDGKTIFTSFTEDSKNAGFPGSNRSKKHFKTMLSKCCKQMTAEDIDSMLGVLDE